MLESRLQTYLTHPTFSMRFPTELESQFRELLQHDQKKFLYNACQLSLLFWCLIAITDYFMLPKQDQINWLIRLFWAFLLLLLPLFFKQHFKHAAKFNFLQPLSMLLTTLGLGVITARLQSPAHLDYFFMQWVLLLSGWNLLSVIRFRIALFTSVGLILIYGLSAKASKIWDFGITYHILILFVLTLALLENKRRQELNERISFAQKTLQAISQQRLEKTNKQLMHQASRDALTGTYNRRALDHAYSRLWRHALRTQRPISVLFIDVDYFKRYNDTYGHAAGDHCLVWLAEQLQSIAKRPLDFVARFGGEEFVVILPDTHPEQAGIYAEKIRISIFSSQYPHNSSPEGRLTISIGAAGGIPHKEDKETQYLEKANHALYCAKNQGRNRVGHSTKPRSGLTA